MRNPLDPLSWADSQQLRRSKTVLRTLERRTDPLTNTPQSRVVTVRSFSTASRVLRRRCVLSCQLACVEFTRLTRISWDQPIVEGTHFLIPWLQRPILMETRIKPRVRFL